MLHRSAIRRIRRLVEYAVFILTGLAIFHTWFILGFPVACRVDGGSMAPTLLGSHVDLTCPNCRFAFACDSGDPSDTKNWSEGAYAICPNCSQMFGLSQHPQILSGDRVLIDRTAFQFRWPQRWEVVAFNRSIETKNASAEIKARSASEETKTRSEEDQDQGLAVKRVVGLPGEQIRLAHGRIYVNDKLIRKNLRQQRAMRILVHDDEFAGSAPRWRPQDFGSNWTRNDGRPVHTESPNDEIGWLVYNHADVASGDEKPIFVSDYGYYNRGRMQLRNEDIHLTPDVAMSFRLQDLHGRGFISLQATDGRDEFVVKIDPWKKEFEVAKNRKQLADSSGKLPGSLRGETLEVSLIDRQFLFAAGSKTLFAAEIDSPGEPPLSGQPLAIGVQGLGVAIDRFRVYRAIYYGNPPGSGNGPTPTYKLGADEYFVLGDNSPISEDSRTWAEGRAIGHKSLLGKPFLVIYPSCGLPLGPWHIQVPDLTQMRYIR